VVGYGEGGLGGVGLTRRRWIRALEGVRVSGYSIRASGFGKTDLPERVRLAERVRCDKRSRALVAPRSLIVEHKPDAENRWSAQTSRGRFRRCTGQIGTPDYESVEREFERAGHC